jgi:hypothetical protein
MQATLATYATLPGAPSLKIARRGLEICAFASLAAANWACAAALPSPVFSWTSLLVFVWATLILLRSHSRAGILLLPLVITRGATMVSLVFIESGSFMPEVGRVGAPGDASAAFAAFTALFYLVYGLVFAAGERTFLQACTSPLIERVSLLLRWPIVLFCAVLFLLALAHGAQTGFPIFQHVDRFYYRRFYSGGMVLELLEDKFLYGALLGNIVFARRTGPLLRSSALAVQGCLLITFFLFGDKFFTLLTMCAFFAMPYLLRNEHALLKTLARVWLPAAILLGAAFGATLFIYSDYGDAPLEIGMTRLGERIAGQGELWFVASQDDRKLLAYDGHVVDAYRRSLTAPDPAASDFETGMETYFFINRYMPQPLRRSFIRAQGWVQLTMGSEAMALANFGYLGVAILMIVGGAATALPALYLRRAFASEFPISIAMAILISLQAYMVLQQAALWPLFARGQVNRFLLAATLETLILAANWAQTQGRRTSGPRLA